MRTIGNVLWFVLAGLWLAIGYVLAGLLAFVPIVTIVPIPAADRGRYGFPA